MDTFDAKCKFQKLTQSDEASPNVSIPGRVRLRSVFYNRAAPDTRGDRRALSFYNGSIDAANLLFTHWDEVSTWSPTVPCLTLPDHGILFPDGLVIASGNGSTAGTRYFGCITVIYTGG